MESVYAIIHITGQDASSCAATDVAERLEEGFFRRRADDGEENDNG